MQSKPVSIQIIQNWTEKKNIKLKDNIVGLFQCTQSSYWKFQINYLIENVFFLRENSSLMNVRSICFKTLSNFIFGKLISFCFRRTHECVQALQNAKFYLNKPHAMFWQCQFNISYITDTTHTHLHIFTEKSDNCFSYPIEKIIKWKSWNLGKLYGYQRLLIIFGHASDERNK